jgi:hypothetical protein
MAHISYPLSDFRWSRSNLRLLRRAGIHIPLYATLMGFKPWGHVNTTIIEWTFLKPPVRKLVEISIKTAYKRFIRS